MGLSNLDGSNKVVRHFPGDSLEGQPLDCERIVRWQIPFEKGVLLLLGLFLHKQRGINPMQPSKSGHDLVLPGVAWMVGGCVLTGLQLGFSWASAGFTGPGLPSGAPGVGWRCSRSWGLRFMMATPWARDGCFWWRPKVQRQGLQFERKPGHGSETTRGNLKPEV